MTADSCDSTERTREHYSRAARITAAGGDPLSSETSDDVNWGNFGAGRYGELDLVAVPAAASRGSLGCGNPVAVADLRPGESVLDLGSGGGLDVLLSSRRVGPAGKVYGLDMTEEMLALARRNVAAAGVRNVELLRGRIEDVPLPAETVDVVISNCVIALSTDKNRVLSEAYRVLVSGGRLGIVDIVADDDADPSLRVAADCDVNCVALRRADYLAGLEAAGFVDASVTFTHEVGDGVHSAIVHAVKAAALQAAVERPSRLAATIAALRPEHADEVLAIYQAGADTGDATFETTAPTWERFDAAHLAGHRFVGLAPETGQVLGWVAVAPVSDRCVYGGVVEESVYIGADARGQGVAKALLRAVIESTEQAGIWTLQAGIFPENTGSLRLHEALGFRIVGVRERIGRHVFDGQDRWRDVVLLERRSERVG